MSGRIQSCFFSMSTTGRDLSPEFLLITSVHKDNCGETRFTTGMHFERAVIVGRLTEYVLCLLHVDAIRLDHFRGFAAAWHVPAGASTAQTGQWVQGPGADFFQAVSRELGGLPFIVEDLGIITPDVRALRDQFQLPGTRVLQFAFDGHPDNPYLPQNFVSNTVVYTGTHDNAPTREWYEELPDYQRQNFWNYLKRAPGGSPDAAPALMDLAWSSKAALAIAPLQDLLNLGAESRMNVPGRAAGNWGWRCREDMLSQPTFEWLRNLTEVSKRSGASAGAQEGSLGNESMPVAASRP